MRIRRGGPAWLGPLVVLALLVATGLPGTPARGLDVKIEAEQGAVDNPVCGDGTQQMKVYERPDVSGGAHVFYPASGCSQTFSGQAPLETVTSIRFYFGGESMDVEHCGHFRVSGGVVGTTSVVCALPRRPMTATFRATYRAGPFTITWVPDEFRSPSWIDAWVDYLTGS